MKTTLFGIGLSVVLMEQALAQTSQPGPSSAVTNNIPPDALVSKVGAVYRKFHVVKADPAGLIISYVPGRGGFGLEKVPFDVLPDYWQKRYKYDPEQAAQFVLEQRQAMAYWRGKMIADEKAYRERRAQLEAAEEAAAEQARLEAEAAAKAAEAAATQTTNAPGIEATNAPAIEATNTPAMTETNQPPSGGS
jgi:hypothetical protein